MFLFGPFCFLKIIFARRNETKLKVLTAQNKIFVESIFAEIISCTTYQNQVFFMAPTIWFTRRNSVSYPSHNLRANPNISTNISSVIITTETDRFYLAKLFQASVNIVPASAHSTILPWDMIMRLIDQLDTVSIISWIEDLSFTENL